MTKVENSDAMNRVERVGRPGQANIDRLGGALRGGFHQMLLFAIGATMVWSAFFAFWGMVSKGHASVEDILLLFIYLELGAMVGIHFYNQSHAGSLFEICCADRSNAASDRRG